MSCSGHFVLLVLICQFDLSRLTFPSCPVLGWSCPGKFCPGCSVMTYLPQRSCFSFPVPSVLSCLLWPSCLSRLWLSHPDCLSSCPVLAVMSRLSFTGCLSQHSLPPALLSPLSCSKCPVSLLHPGCPSQMPCPSCHVLADRL